MIHQFYGGPLADIVIDLDAVLADETLRRQVPWESYEKIATAVSDEGVIEMIQWRFRGADIETPNDVTLKPHKPLSGSGGFSVVQAAMSNKAKQTPALHVKSLEELDDELQSQVHQVYERFDTSTAPELPVDDHEKSSDAIAEQARVVDQPAVVIAPDANSGEIWRTFEERRKVIKLARGKFGEACGLTTSFGWRLESGNVSSGDIKKLGLNSVEEVYAKADAVLRSFEGD